MQTNEGIVQISPKSLVRRKLHQHPFENIGQLLTNALENTSNLPRKAWIYVEGDDIVIEDEGGGLSLDQLKTAGESPHYGAGTISRFGEGIPLVANTTKRGLLIESNKNGVYERFKLFPQPDGMHWALEDRRRVNAPSGTRVHILGAAPSTEFYKLPDFIKEFRAFGLISGDDEIYLGLDGKASCKRLEPPELPDGAKELQAASLRGWLWDSWPSSVKLYYRGQLVGNWSSTRYRIGGIVEYLGTLGEEELTDDKKLIRKTSSWNVIDEVLRRRARDFVAVEAIATKLNLLGTKILREVLRALDMVQVKPRGKTKPNRHPSRPTARTRKGTVPRQSIMVPLGTEYPTFAIVDSRVVFNNTSMTCQSIVSCSGPVQKGILQTLCSVTASVFLWQKESSDWETINKVILEAETCSLKIA